MSSGPVINLPTQWGIHDNFSIFLAEGYIPQVAATKMYHKTNWVF
jgi:hypothetical protein